MTAQVELETPSDIRSRITEAAARLLRDDGVAGVTMRAVGRAAGVPAPTIFRIFGDKHGLLDAVAEHVMATYVAAKSELAVRESGGPVEDLRNAWRLHVEFGLANPDLYVLLSAPGRIQRSPATAAGVGVLEVRVGRLATAGLLGVTESRAVGLIHAAGTGAVFALLQQPSENRDLALADTMLEAVLHAILTTTPAPPASSLATLVITFRAAVPDLPTLSDAERALLEQWLTRTVHELQN